MYEVFPLLAGVAIALFVYRFVAPRTRAIMLVGLSVLFGVLATIISGELARSPLYILIDTGFVLFAAVVTALLVTWWQRRTMRLP